MDEALPGDIEDIEACAREGRRPRDAGPYRVLVGDALFRFHPIVVPQPVCTGRALLDFAELSPHEHFICFALQTDGLLEEIRLDETIDLREGVERFLAFKNDRLFRFLLDGREFQWGGAYIAGSTLLTLAKADANSHGVWLRLSEGAERAIGAGQLVDLGEPGVEVFVTRPKATAPA